MSGRALLWAAGLGGSVAAHAAVAGLLLVALRPDPVTEQPTPQSRLDVKAYDLERTAAKEAPPPSEAASEASAEGASLDPGAIPQSRAEQLTATAQPLAPRPASGPVVYPAAPPAQALTAGTAPAAPAAAVIPAALPLAPSPEPAATALPAALPDSVAADPLTPPTAPAALAVPESQPLDLARPTTQKAPEAAPQAASVKATLAFPGGDGTVDPASLAAFQSFMQPGDIQGEDPLRDGVSALLAQVPCSRLQVSFDPETTTLQVNGHIPEGDLRAPVLAALQAQMGADIGVSDNILILPRPQCGALAGISEVNLPQSTDQITNPLLIGEDTQARVLGFVKDQRLFFDITAPDYPAYVYVDYFDADGNVLHLAPNEQVPLTRAEPESAIRIGAEKAGDPGLQMLVGPPYGQEIAVAFAASSPLYDGLRPLLEPAAPYLAELKDRVAQARAADPGFKGEWVYFFVTTAER